MKWLPFSILALVALVLQTTVVPHIAIGGIVPDLMFILVVHYALWGQWPDAGIAAWLVGFVLGTQTVDPIGLHAFCYGAASWGIFRMRQALFREHPLTQIVITFVFAWAIQLMVWYMRHRSPASRVTWGEVFWASTLAAVYTAACAPYLHWVLHRAGRWTGLRGNARATGYR